MPWQPQTPSQQQRGAVLIMSLVFLLILILLSLSSARTSMTEEKISRNLHDRDLALQAAESALRAAESILSQRCPAPTPCAEESCQVKINHDPPPRLTDKPHDWWLHNGIAHAATTLASVASDPRYFITLQARIADSLVVGTGPIRYRSIYQITARGTGRHDTSTSILQTLFITRCP